MYAMLESPYKQQSGVIPYRWSQESLEILVVTSRRTGKWGIPKGNVEIGLSPPESAQQEAWEEAGVTGEVGYDPIGTYHYTKHHRTYEVTVYPLQVLLVHETWLEDTERERRWMNPQQAANAVPNIMLRELLRSWAKQMKPDQGCWPT
ncbi:MAG: NUDIX hydrolase [Deltaproteobacteria bacterium]|nr:MAG: NUDIX hydrolase [Deltaproteobacteria bacterium]